MIEENLQVGNVSYSLIQADKVYAVVEKGAYSPEIRMENISESEKMGRSYTTDYTKQSLIKGLF